RLDHAPVVARRLLPARVRGPRRAGARARPRRRADEAGEDGSPPSADPPAPPDSGRGSSLVRGSLEGRSGSPENGRTMILAALALLATVIQDPTPAPPAAIARPAEDEGWKDVDHLVLVVNEESVTSWTLYRLVQREKRDHPKVDDNQTARKILTDLRNKMISVQAGEDMGLDPAMLEQSAKNILDREMGNKTGTDKSEYLASRGGGSTLNDRQKYWKDMILSRTWEQSITGEAPP